MIPVTSFAGKTVAVFGLGGSGMAVCEALRAGGADVVACDDNLDSMVKATQANFMTADLRKVAWTNFAALILAPGVPLTHPQPHWTVRAAQSAGVEVIGDIELFCRERRLHAPDAPFVAITGTNGKSTTTALVAHLMREAGYDTQMGGNIGTAILSLQPPAPGRVHVIEMSSYQIDLCPSLDPTIGILLNISEDHIDRHGTLEHYAAVKARLVAGAQISLVSVDDPLSDDIGRRLSENPDLDVIPVSVKKALKWGYFLRGSEIMDKGHNQTPEEAEVLADISGVGSLRGLHNAQNAVFACAAAWHMHVKPEEIARGIRTFPGLAHRMEQIGRRNGVLYVNDSKATNADAAARALSSFEDIYWIAGGKPKTGGIEPLADFFPRVRKAFLIGEAAQDFAATLEGRVPCEISGTMDVAIPAAAAAAEADGIADAVVLLSPACASFDQFRNFEIRGDRFKELVMGLGDVAGLSR